MKNRQIPGLIGSLLMIVGVFTPLVSLPMVGTINYFNNGEGDGVFLLILGAISLVLVSVKWYRGLWLSGGAALALLIFSFVTLMVKIEEMKSQMQGRLVNNPYRGIADLAMQSIQIQWGWALMAIGAGFIIAAAYLTPIAPVNNEGTEEFTFEDEEERITDGK
jgi:hypothetical protein